MKKILDTLLLITIACTLLVVGFTCGSLYQMEQDYKICSPCQESNSQLRQQLDSCITEKERRQRFLNFYLQKTLQNETIK